MLGLQNTPRTWARGGGGALSPMLPRTISRGRARSGDAHRADTAARYQGKSNNMRGKNGEFIVRGVPYNKPPNFSQYVFGPTLMMCGRFGAVCLAAVRPERLTSSRIFVRKTLFQKIST